MIFDIEGDLRGNEGGGALVGEWGINAVCCLETDDGQVAWPTYNPRQPTVTRRRRRRG